jgi:DNA-binding beta-propeller fold protein YncE
MTTDIERPHPTDYEVLLRAGFPYEKTLGMRRITWYPIDIEVGPNNEVYCLGRFDVGGSIRTVSWDDKDLGGIGGGWTWPAGITKDQEGLLYISDEGAHNITMLRTDGEEIGRWGEYGSELGQLNRPSHMVFDSDGNILISDTQNHRIQKFSSTGEFISSFGNFGDKPGQFNMPWGISVTPEYRGC